MFDFSIKGMATAEEKRLMKAGQRTANWKRWGPYLPERQWGTVREDYSENSDSWGHFTFDKSKSRAYRWGEDGIMGFTDRECRLCFSLTFWNGKDSILKERLFGLTNGEGNHGEDAKELYYYLDSTPTHSYFKGLYKYTQKAFPYEDLKAENARRGLKDREYEIDDTDAFNDDTYFDVQAEYAKKSVDDMLIKITISNRSKESAHLDFLPTLLYRNTWIWGCEHDGCTLKPQMKQVDDDKVWMSHETLGEYYFCTQPQDGVKFIFTENETNTQELYGHDNYTPYVKDAFHRYIINGEKEAIQPEQKGTKLAVHYNYEFGAGETKVFKMRLFSKKCRPRNIFGSSFDSVFNKRIREADAFYKKNSSKGVK